MAMIRSAPICLAESTPSNPTAPSPTTATVEPGFTLAASAANQPVPMTSESVSKLGIKSSEGISGVATKVPSASGTRRKGRSEEHTSELQSQSNLVCRLLLEKKKKNINNNR